MNEGTQLNRAIIAPIIAVILMMLKQTSGFTFDNINADLITDAVLSIVSLYGIFAHPVKPSDPKE